MPTHQQPGQLQEKHVHTQHNNQHEVLKHWIQELWILEP